MKTLRYAALALAVSGVFTLGAKAADTTNAWWNITFDDALGAYMPDRPEEAMVVLTNKFKESPPVDQPWSAGYWTTGESDETTVTNSYFPTNTFKAFGQDTCIKLDTQGDDLTWWTSDTNSVAQIESMRTLVDADLYLVGSDSAPDAGDFDNGENVQTAIYLMNETDEDGLTTNSVLCVYVRNASGSNYWQELKGVKLYDNDWAHVQVIVDHSVPAPGTPKVRVYVNNVQMTARYGDDYEWTVANLVNAQAVKKVSSISFRGTGAVDNFVGQVVEVNPDKYDFTAEVYMDGTNVLATGENAGNVTRTVNTAAGEGWKVTFPNFMFHDYNSQTKLATYALTKVELIDAGTGATTTYNYTYDQTSHSVSVDVENTAVVVETVTDTYYDDEREEEVEYTYQTGEFSVTAPTAGATSNATIVKVYFKTIGLCDAKAVTVDVGGETTTDVTSLKPTDYPTNLVWKFPASKPGYVLSTIQTAADVTYEGGYATVSTNLQTLTADTTFVTATYVEGTLAEGQELRYSFSDGTYTFEAYTPPVAIIVAGNVTNEYPSLRAAITNAVEGDTIYLVADDHVSFSATATEIGITKTLTIDGGSNTLYGVTDYAHDGHNDHDIYIGGSGNVTIKNLTLSEFSDTAPTVQYRTYPIWTGKAYAGTLVLDGVTVTNYARTAVNLSGGSFLITNCVFAGYADAASPTRYYQDAVVVFNATGTVANTTVTGVGDANTGYGASVFTVNSSGAGEITVKSGSYTGSYIAAVNSNATGRITIEGGTFVATNTNGEGGAPDSAFEPANTVGKIVITGGWFNLEPEAEFLPAGYGAEKAKPDTDPAPWTVVLANAIWIGGASGDWNVPANWDIGLVPTTTTVVTFTNDATVGISPTVCKCKEMVLDGANVTIGRADPSKGADLNFYKNAGSAVSGTGTLTLNTVGLFNQNNSGVLTIGTDFDIQGDVTFKGVKDENGGAGSWTITNDTTIADGVTVKSIDDAITTFQGDIDIASGAQVTFFAAFGANESYHGGEIVASKVTLAHNEGSPATTLVMQTRNKGKITINDSQIVTDSNDYYVKKSSQELKDGNATIYQTTYEVLPKRTVVTVAATDVTVEGVSEGLLFVPGTNFVITVTGFGEGYEPSVMITNGTSVLLTTNVASFTYTAPDSDIYVVATKVLKTFDITFKPENDSSDIVTNVAYGATAYAPADPTLDGFEFLGWTNALDAADTTLYSNANLPAATANATYAAKWEANPVVEPIPVTIGGDAVNALPEGTAPITIVNSGDTHTFTLRFAAKQVGVTYVLQASTTVNGQFADVENGANPVAVTPQAIDEVVELTDPNATQNAKFYRVKVVVE